MTYRFID